MGQSLKISNMNDYAGFTNYFGTQILFGANEVKLGKQRVINIVLKNNIKVIE